MRNKNSGWRSCYLATTRWHWPTTFDRHRHARSCPGPTQRSVGRRTFAAYEDLDACTIRTTASGRFVSGASVTGHGGPLVTYAWRKKRHLSRKNDDKPRTSIDCINV
jgi:hypothetical protein